MISKNEFLEKHIFGWMKDDLERMTKMIPANDGKIGSINLPLALCILAYMEYLGSFFTGKEQDSKNIDVFILRCFKNQKEYPKGLLPELFRNSLAHEYFPRGGISRKSIRPAVYRFKTSETPILDIESLLKDFIESLNEFEKRLDDSTYHARMKQSNKRVSNLINKYKNSIEKLEESSPLPITPTAFNSLVSTSPVKSELIKPLD